MIQTDSGSTNTRSRLQRVNRCRCNCPLYPKFLTLQSMIFRQRFARYSQVLVVTKLAIRGTKCTCYRGGSRIPCRRGRQPSEGACQHTILSNFPKNCMKSRKFWTVGGGGGRAPGAPPLNPPLCYHHIQLCTNTYGDHYVKVLLYCKITHYKIHTLYIVYDI